MGTLHKLDCLTTLNIPAEKVLDGAKQADLKNVVVIGYDQEGEAYFASSLGNDGETLWLIEKAKKFLMEDEEEK